MYRTEEKMLKLCNEIMLCRIILSSLSLFFHVYLVVCWLSCS